MSESSIITKTKKPITINSICQDLIKLGVNRGDVLQNYLDHFLTH